MKQKVPQTQCAIQFFGLPYPPFADTFDIQTPFQSDAEALIIQRTLALIQQGRSLAISGEAGTGKSMMIKTIISELDTKQFRCAIIPYGGIKPSVLLRDLCELLDIATEGRKSLLSRLAQDFMPRNEKPFPVIIVDEAHEMDNQSFLDLCSLLHNARTRTAAAALILVGQPALKKKLELDIFSPVKTRLTSLFAMPKLSIDESIEFLQYRMKIAKADSSIFDETAITDIATDAKGNRRLLMNLAAVCLEEAARRNDKVVTSEIVSEMTECTV
ncbi:MAG: ATP-binding protein [Chitinivibrionales bacterium]|nr:ATP-binding protein [Chitinivibrionales bacterium]